MIVLDTPLLEDLLQGRRRARRWMADLQARGEVAATEVSLFELSRTARSGRGSPSALRRRLEALEALRKALTVLPLDPEGSRKAAELRFHAKGGGVDPLFALILGTCMAHGATEILVRAPRKAPKRLGALSVVRV